MLIDKIVRAEVRHVDSVAGIVAQHLLRQFLESVEAMRSADLEESVAIFLHHGREKVFAGLNHVRIFPFRVAVAIVVNQSLESGQRHVRAVLLIADQGRDLEQTQIQTVGIQLNGLLNGLGRLTEQLVIVGHNLKIVHIPSERVLQSQGRSVAKIFGGIHDLDRR